MADKPTLRAVASVLAGSAQRAGLVDGFDPNIWFPWILQLLPLLQVCFPKADDAFDELSWRASSRWWDEIWPWARKPDDRTDRYRDRLKARARRASDLPAETVDLVMESAFVTIDAGRLPPSTFRAAYAEIG